ncbi:unnamed protein product [Parnassius apollo]|uniref:(apollo) hypothetical protein n=1 Tax=Parnassius apollo TaxID=110799 RepID=A0A8S3XTZ2_PARAO|nr:unnamed protein product [Parnassius apollo]
MLLRDVFLAQKELVKSIRNTEVNTGIDFECDNTCTQEIYAENRPTTQENIGNTDNSTLGPSTSKKRKPIKLQEKLDKREIQRLNLLEALSWFMMSSLLTDRIIKECLEQEDSEEENVSEIEDFEEHSDHESGTEQEASDSDGSSVSEESFPSNLQIENTEDEEYLEDVPLKAAFQTKPCEIRKKYPMGSALRTDFIKKKKKELFSQQNIFVNQHDELEAMVKTSYEILLLAKKKKPFSDGDIIKQSLTIFAQNCNDQKVKAMADSISLSRNTVMRRVEEMSTDIISQITEFVTKCRYFSLALDETCDLTGTAQLAVFVRCIDDNFNIFHGLLDLCQLETTTTGKDIFMKLKDCVEGKNLNWDKCNSVCTDGAPAMMGKTNGAVALLQNHIGRQLFSYHCIIHQEALCAKDMTFDDEINPVVRCINFIRARALNRRQYRTLFEEEIKEYCKLHLYCAKIENQYWDHDMRFDNVIDELIINLGNDSDSEEDMEIEDMYSNEEEEDMD